jgi:carbon storage regulator CsrA
MLVLSRNLNERIVITVPPSTSEQMIEVTLVDLRKDRAKIGFEADRSIVIHRQEVQSRIDRGETLEDAIEHRQAERWDGMS